MNAEKARRALFLAAARVLSALNDDHESCALCGSEEGQTHEAGSACAELENAVNALQDARLQEATR